MAKNNLGHRSSPGPQKRNKKSKFLRVYKSYDDVIGEGGTALMVFFQRYYIQDLQLQSYIYLYGKEETRNLITPSQKGMYLPNIANCARNEALIQYNKTILSEKFSEYWKTITRFFQAVQLNPEVFQKEYNESYKGRRDYEMNEYLERLLTFILENRDGVTSYINRKRFDRIGKHTLGMVEDLIVSAIYHSPHSKQQSDFKNAYRRVLREKGTAPLLPYYNNAIIDAVLDAVWCGIDQAKWSLPTITYADIVSKWDSIRMSANDRFVPAKLKHTFCKTCSTPCSEKLAALNLFIPEGADTLFETHTDSVDILFETILAGIRKTRWKIKPGLYSVSGFDVEWGLVCDYVYETLILQKYLTVKDDSIRSVQFKELFK